MPVKRQDTERTQKANPEAQQGRKAADGADGETTRYGMGHDAELNPRAEETQEQEYKVGGLKETEKYVVDKSKSPPDPVK